MMLHYLLCGDRLLPATSFPHPHVFFYCHHQDISFKFKYISIHLYCKMKPNVSSSRSATRLPTWIARTSAIGTLSCRTKMLETYVGPTTLVNFITQSDNWYLWYSITRKLKSKVLIPCRAPSKGKFLLMFKPGMSTYRDILPTQFVSICEEPIRFTGGGLHSKNESQSGGILKNVKKALASRTKSQAPIDGSSIISIWFFAFT